MYRRMRAHVRSRRIPLRFRFVIEPGPEPVLLRENNGHKEAVRGRRIKGGHVFERYHRQTKQRISTQVCALDGKRDYAVWRVVGKKLASDLCEYAISYNNQLLLLPHSECPKVCLQLFDSSLRSLRISVISALNILETIVTQRTQRYAEIAEKTSVDSTR